MLYIIGAVILLAIGGMIGGSNGMGCVFFLLAGFVLWRIGVLGIMIRILSWVARVAIRIIEWILIRMVQAGARIWNFFDENVLDMIILGL